MVVEILSLDIEPKPPMKSSEFHRKIKKDGWVHIRTDGSHYIYEKNKLTFSVPWRKRDGRRFAEIVGEGNGAEIIQVLNHFV